MCVVSLLASIRQGRQPKGKSLCISAAAPEDALVLPFKTHTVKFVDRPTELFLLVSSNDNGNDCHTC